MTTTSTAPQSPVTAPSPGATTIVESLSRGARSGHRLVFLDGDPRPRSVPFAELVEASEERAGQTTCREG